MSILVSCGAPSTFNVAIYPRNSVCASTAPNAYVRLSVFIGRSSVTMQGITPEAELATNTWLVPSKMTIDASAIDIVRCVGIFGSGAFFGMTVTFTNVILPPLLARKITARQRVELWHDMYTSVTHSWVPLGVLASVAYFVAGAQEHNTRLLAAGVSMIAIIPNTLLFVFPLVYKLKDFLKLPDDKFPSEDIVKSTLRSWGLRHWTRTAVAGAAFVVGICDAILYPRV